MQYFLAQFPDDTRLKVLFVQGKKAKVYETQVNWLAIAEFELYNPKPLTMSTVFPGGTSYIGCGMDSMQHCVLGFQSSTVPSDASSSDESDERESPQFDTILDMTSLQFGDAGRGFKGKGLFVLESETDYTARLSTLARDNDFEDAKFSLQLGNLPPIQEKWLPEVAARAKARWDQRQEKTFCGYCGTPEPAKRCTVCRVVYYCGEVRDQDAG